MAEINRTEMELTRGSIFLSAMKKEVDTLSAEYIRQW